MHQLTLTVDTRNSLVLSEASLMLQRLSTNGGLKQDTTVSVEAAPLPPVSVAFDTTTTPIAEPEEETTPYTEGELDSAGMPWDERIHASTKSKVKDGTWTFRRGLDEATKQAVLGEYIKVGLDDTAPKPSNEPTVTQHTAPITDDVPPPPPPPPPVTDNAEITTLPQFLKAVRAKGITPAQVQEACNYVGAANPISLGQDLDKLIEASALLGL